MAEEELLCSGMADSVYQDSRTRADVRLPYSHPNHVLQRLIALVLMCLLGFGSYFCYDNPGALQDNFTDDMSLSTSQFMLLYSWYAWPNVVCCFIGGFLLDRVFGIRFGTVLYTLLVVIGQLVFAFGAYKNSLLITIAGRFVFGLGGESLAVAQNSYAVLWFKGKELNTVFGFQLSFARVGSSVNFMLMEPLYRYVAQYYHGYQCLGIVLFIASGACVMSFVCSSLLAWQDKNAERVLGRNTLSRNEDIARLSDVTTFPFSFWLITLVIVFYYCAVFPLVALGKVFFERKFEMEPNTANIANSMLYFISMFLSPVCGLLVDRMGRNILWIFAALSLSICGHMLLAFTFINPFITMTFMGISYSILASSLWPLICYVVPEYQLGTAYGTAQSIENLGLAIISLVAGIIVDHYGYLLLELFFICCLCFGVLALIFMWIYDISHDGILNMSAERRNLLQFTEENVSESSEREKLMPDVSLNSGNRAHKSRHDGKSYKKINDEESTDDE